MSRGSAAEEEVDDGWWDEDTAVETPRALEEPSERPKKRSGEYRLELNSVEVVEVVGRQAKP